MTVKTTTTAENGVCDVEIGEHLKAAHDALANHGDGKIAEHVGVDEKTVAKYRKQLKPTPKDLESPTRTGRDGRTTNTTNIGRRAERKCGQLLTKMDGHGSNQHKRKSHADTSLAELGISKMQSHRWQTEAVPMPRSRRR